MRDKVFIDINIFVYAFLDDSKNNDNYIKHLKSKEFLKVLMWGQLTNAKRYLSVLEIRKKLKLVLTKEDIID